MKLAESIFDRLSKVEDSTEEVFELFAVQHDDATDLGMLAPGDAVVDITIGSQDFSITQSPGLLQSEQQQGTTGAALWQSSVRFAHWLQAPNLILDEASADTTVLELGSGGTGLVSCVLASRLGPKARVVASDMSYTMKLLRENIAANTPSRSKMRKASQQAQIDVIEFDWERHDAKSMLQTIGLAHGVDLIVACDCIYNYALIQPFLDSCTDICMARQALQPTMCIVVQQLRQPDVFEEWLSLALERFEIWRLPVDVVSEELTEKHGFVVHMLVLR